MAIGAGTVTLADYALMSNSPLIQKVTYSLILYANVIQDIPLVEKKSLVVNGARFEGNLPTVNWSQLNAEGVTTKGTPTPYQEQAYIIRNYIDVNKIDAGGVDLSQGGLTQATANKFLEQLDQLLWSVHSPTGSGVVLYMNEVMRRRFAFAMRTMGTSGGLAITQDQFNRTIEMYKGAVIRDPGYKADQSTRIITTTETNLGADGSSNFTSIYAVNYDTAHFFGWQFNPPNVQDLGLIYNGAIYRTLIDWACGLVNTSNRSLGRLYDIKIS